MSTRATIHFEEVQTHEFVDDARKELAEPVTHTSAIVYRHSDGYPEGLGDDLSKFIQAVRQLRDTRLSDPSYLAAKWVVFDAVAYQEMMDSIYKDKPDTYTKLYGDRNPLAFLSVGIVQQDPGDIEYRYHVNCDGKVESIVYEKRGGSWDDPVWNIAGTIDTKEAE